VEESPKVESWVAVETMKWGLTIPSIGKLVINARFDEVMEKPMFKGLVSQKRCILYINGYYEWHQKTNKPHLICTQNYSIET